MSQTVRIMPCLDMQNGRVVKGVHFGVIGIGELKAYLSGRGVAVL